MSTEHEHHDGHHEELTAEEVRTRAVEQLLREKGVVTEEEIENFVKAIESSVGFMLGAKVVAHAWKDPKFKQQLLADANQAIEGIGIDTADTKIVVIENTPTTHNVVCCTLCSCYPWRILGLPPTWYKSSEYRSRVVIDPRAVLKDFGTHIPDDVEVRVWDSTSECRYMVLPLQPAHTERLSEEQLAELVTRDSMVGVTLVPEPSAHASV
jgi:nitrile hydratase